MPKDETISFKEIHIVKCGKKTIGEIRQVKFMFGEGGKLEGTGWRYFPKNKKEGGMIFGTLADCKVSLLSA